MLIKYRLLCVPMERKYVVPLSLILFSFLSLPYIYKQFFLLIYVNIPLYVCHAAGCTNTISVGYSTLCAMSWYCQECHYSLGVCFEHTNKSLIPTFSHSDTKIIYKHTHAHIDSTDNTVKLHLQPSLGPKGTTVIYEAYPSV